MKLRGVIALALALSCAPAIGQSNQGSSALSITKGGTGQDNRSAGISALLPTPTGTGDILYWDSGTSSWKTLAGNNSGTLCLQENSSGVPSWSSCGSGGGGMTSTAAGGTGADNSTNAAGSILSSGSANGTFAARTLNAICSLAPSMCNAALGYTSIFWYGAVCDGTTNDTAAIQATFNSFGYAGGAVLIPATAFGGTNSGRAATGGCVIRLPASPLRANCALVINKRIRLFGQGPGSLFKTEATMANTTDNICIDVSDVNWDGVKFENFAIGLEGEYHPSAPTSTYRRYGKRGLAFLINSNPQGFQNLTVENVMVGESFNDYGIWFEGLATQGSKVIHSDIFGGLAWNQVADSNQTLFNRILGGSGGTFGLMIDAPGAGKNIVEGNSITAPAGIILKSGAMTSINKNYIEQGYNTNPIGTIIDIQDSATWTTITDNLIQSFSSPVVVPITNRGGAAFTHLSGNVISAAGVQGGNNFNANFICNGMNIWNVGGAHINNGGAGALKNAIGGAVADCP